jgi:predicted lipoprotein with Yx(FWY)xxD motif
MIGSAVRRAALGAASLAVLGFNLVGAVHASGSVSVGTSTQLGQAIVTDERGFALYRLLADEGGASACYDWCARAWPPVLVDDLPAVDDPRLASQLGTTVRRDGSLQLTFGGAPLYTYTGDRDPGDTNGQGAGGLWFVVDAPATIAE